MKTHPRPPKNTAVTLKIQYAACYLRVSGYTSAYLALKTLLSNRQFPLSKRFYQNQSLCQPPLRVTPLRDRPD